MTETVKLKGIHTDRQIDREIERLGNRQKKQRLGNRKKDKESYRKTKESQTDRETYSGQQRYRKKDT